MKPILTILLLTSLTLHSQTIDLKYDFSKTDKWVTYTGAAMLAAEFTFDKPSTRQEFNIKVIKCSMIVITTAGILIKNNRKSKWKINNNGVCRTIKYNKYGIKKIKR